MATNPPLKGVLEGMLYAEEKGKIVSIERTQERITFEDLERDLLFPTQ